MSLSNFRTGPMGPAVHCFAIVPHATNPLPVIPKAIRANTAGDVVFRALDSEADVTMTLAAGEVLPVVTQFVRVRRTMRQWKAGVIGWQMPACVCAEA